jgi:hypothetical protein
MQNILTGNSEVPEAGSSSRSVRETLDGKANLGLSSSANPPLIDRSKPQVSATISLMRNAWHNDDLILWKSLFGENGSRKI